MPLDMPWSDSMSPVLVLVGMFVAALVLKMLLIVARVYEEETQLHDLLARTHALRLAIKEDLARQAWSEKTIIAMQTIAREDAATAAEKMQSEIPAPDEEKPLETVETGDQRKAA